MNKKVLDYINRCEGWKSAIKSLHWAANSLSQHELCDDIADSIAEFQDTVSEVEQSITGKLKVNSLNPTEYKIKDLKSFVQDVLDETNSFYKKVKDMGDTYVGMASDCESFLSDMQRKLYLVNFTLKEEFKREFREKLNEAMYKRVDNPSKKSRSNVTTLKTRINHIYDAVKEHGLDSRLYHDEAWQAIDFYHKVITDKFGGEVEVTTKPCADLRHADSIESDGGYCDYDEYDHMPRSKQYAIEIEFPDGMKVSGYIKCMAAGTVEDPFSSYDTCMVLWPKNNRMLENREMRNESITEYGDKPETREMMGAAAKRALMRNGDTSVYQNALNSLGKRNSTKDDYNDMQRGFEMENRQIKLSEAELKQVVKEAAIQVLKETPLDYDIDNLSGRWTKPKNWNIPNRDLTSGEEYIDDEGYLDDPYKKNEIEDALKDDEWEWGKDMDLKGAENYYSWDRFDGKPIAQGIDPYYKVGKGAVGREVDDAISRRNKENDWSDRELMNGDRMMDKWVSGKRDADDIEDAWDDLHYEGKKPLKVTESELKTLVREAAMQIINEYNQRMAKTKGFVKSTHGHRSGKKREATPEERAEARRRLGIKEPETVEQESIEIKPENKGKFTATKKATGKSTEELTHSKNPLTRKRAIFAQNAKRWSKK